MPCDEMMWLGLFRCVKPHGASGFLKKSNFPSQPLSYSECLFDRSLNQSALFLLLLKFLSLFKIVDFSPHECVIGFSICSFGWFPMVFICVCQHLGSPGLC